MLFAAYQGRGDAAAKTRGRVHRKTAPSGANLQQMIFRRKSQLAANAVELLKLCLCQRVIFAFEKGAGIRHGRIKEQLIKLVAEVVMMANILSAPGNAVPAQTMLRNISYLANP